MGGNVQVVNNLDELNAILAKAKAENKCVVVDFWAPWCGPCRMMAPAFEEMSKTYEAQSLFVKVDVDKAEDIAKEYSIRAMPTFIMFKGDQKVEELVGASKDKLETMVKNQVATL